MAKTTEEYIDEQVEAVRENPSPLSILYKEGKEVASANFIARTTGVVSGVDVALLFFKKYNSKIQYKILKNNGQYVNRGDVIAVITGPVEDIKKCEKAALSYIRYMSGIASAVRKYVEELNGLDSYMLFSGYSIPGLEELAAKAFLDGGGIIEENMKNLVYVSKNDSDHFATFQEIYDKIKFVDKTCKINFEVTNLDEFEEAYMTNCKFIRVSFQKIGLLDDCQSINRDNRTLEACGEMDSRSVRGVAQMGYKYIIIPSLTDGAKSLNIDLCFYKRIIKIRK